MSTLTLHGFDASSDSSRSSARVRDTGPAQFQEMTLLDRRAESEREQLVAIMNRLRQLLHLPVGWDGYQAGPVSPGIVDFASSILASVMTPDAPIPSIVPSSNGRLQIEWHRKGLDIELFVEAPMQAELLIEYDDAREPIELNLTSDYTVLTKALAEIA